MMKKVKKWYSIVSNKDAIIWTLFLCCLFFIALIFIYCNYNKKFIETIQIISSVFVPVFVFGLTYNLINKKVPDKIINQKLNVYLISSITIKNIKVGLDALEPIISDFDFKNINQTALLSLNNMINAIITEVDFLTEYVNKNLIEGNCDNDSNMTFAIHRNNISTAASNSKNILDHLHFLQNNIDDTDIHIHAIRDYINIIKSCLINFENDLYPNRNSPENKAMEV